MTDPIRRLRAPASGALDRLLEAAAAEIRSTGYPGLTIRLVARRAGVSSATAYNYFSSKEHLLASLFWHKLSAMPSPPEDPAEPATTRIARVVQSFADLISADPELEGAYRAALMAEDADALRVRDAISAHLIHQFDWALGSELSRTGKEAVRMAFVGGMVLAGAGAIPFDALGERIAEIVRLLH